MGNDLYLKYAKQLSEPEPSDPQKEVENQSVQTEIPALGSVSQNELIYALPQGGHVWLTHWGDKKDNNDNMIATVIHNNKLSSTPTGPTASAMLGGGGITTVGPKNQLINDVVWKCLRGEEPKVPIGVGMGEFIMINQETGEREQVKLGEKDIDE